MGYGKGKKTKNSKTTPPDGTHTAAAEMPSITSLLDRKKLSKTKGSDSKVSFGFDENTASSEPVPGAKAAPAQTAFTENIFDESSQSIPGKTKTKTDVNSPKENSPSISFETNAADSSSSTGSRKTATKTARTSSAQELELDLDGASGIELDAFNPPPKPKPGAAPQSDKQHPKNNKPVPTTEVPDPIDSASEVSVPDLEMTATAAQPSVPETASASPPPARPEMNSKSLSPPSGKKAAQQSPSPTLVAVQNRADLSNSLQGMVSPTPALNPAHSPPPTQKGPAKLQIVASTGRKAPVKKKIVFWQPGRIAKSSDPIGRALHELLQKGAKSALFLVIAPPTGNQKLPTFRANAAVADQRYEKIWTGLTWNPMIVPEIWKAFVKRGIVQLEPDGEATQEIERRNKVLRQAFGASSTEWLTLVRAGPAKRCRGVLALISDRSIRKEVKSLKKLISTPVKKKDGPKAA